MIDPASGFNKGYCFVTYCSPGESTKACEQVRLDLLFEIFFEKKSLFSLMVMKYVQESLLKQILVLLIFDYLLVIYQKPNPKKKSKKNYQKQLKVS